MLNDINTFFDNKLEASSGLYTLSPTTSDVLDKFYANLEALGYNLTELKPALEQNGNALIISCAGSGKTTFLELKLIHDYLSGELFTEREVQTASGVMKQKVISRVFISTFLKTGAEELKNSFDEKCTELRVQGICADNFTFSTLHAEYYSILTAIGVKPTIMPEADCTEALAATCKSLSIRNKTRYHSGAISRDEVTDIACIVGYARNRIDEARYKHPLSAEYGLTQGILDKLLELYKKRRLAVNSYDFEDLQELVYTGIATNPKFAEFVGSRYDYIFIDEFQDTSQIQYEILKAYIRNAKKTVAIGDDDQCIYSWRGSDIDIITKRFPDDFKPAVHKFTVNYRCRANILAPVIPSIKRNTNRYDKDLTAYKAGGLVVVNNTCNVDSLMNEVRNSVAQAYSVGILSRTNFDLLAPAILLELDNTIPFTLSKSVGITGYIPRQVFGCIKLLTRRYTEDFRSLLELFAERDGKFECKKLCDILATQPETSLNTFTDEDLAYSAPILYRNFFKPVRACQDKRSAYIELLKYLLNNSYTGTSPFAIRARLFVAFVMDLVLNHHSLKAMPIEDLDELFSNILPSRLSKRAYAKKQEDCPVRLTTVHEAKGKEWQSVIIWNDTDGVFPAQVGRHILTSAEYEEERRLHYIAFTRAKERLTIFTSETAPSPYLRECDFEASVAVQIEDTPLSEQAMLEPKEITPVPDKFRNTLTEFMNANESDCPEAKTYRDNTLCLLQAYNYDIERTLTEIQSKYRKLFSSADCTSPDEDFRAQMNMCIFNLLEELSEAQMGLNPQN